MEPLLRNAFRNTSPIPTTPPAPLRWLRDFFLMVQPPLLCQEGNCPPHIHSHLHRPRLQPDHSDRSVLAGSIRMARKTGSRQASADAQHKMTTTTAYVTASRCETPNSI